MMKRMPRPSKPSNSRARRLFGKALPDLPQLLLRLFRATGFGEDLAGLRFIAAPNSQRGLSGTAKSRKK